jgi:hypothetical protein
VCCVWSGWLAGGFNSKQASSKLNFLSVSARLAFARPGKGKVVQVQVQVPVTQKSWRHA